VVSQPCRAASHFLLRAQEKVTKEKDTPVGALRVREDGPGFSTGLLSWRKGIDIRVDAPAGLIVPPSPPLRGPKCRSRASERALRAALSRGVTRALPWLLNGFPSAGWRVGGNSPQGTGHGCPVLFARTRVLSKSPFTRNGPEGPLRRVPFLLVTFLDSGHPCPPPFGPASLFAHAPVCAWTSKEK
jgi:hypothetical protein